MSRGMQHDRISIDPAVMVGKPVIKGTRIPVYLILRELGRGATFQLLQDEYRLTEEDVRAALAYAAEHMEPFRHAA